MPPSSSPGQYWFFPVVMGGAVLGMIGLMQLGLAPATALILTEVCAAAVVIWAERVWPFVSSWNHSHGDLAADIGHALVSGTSAQRLLPPVLQPIGVVLAGFLSDGFGLDLWPRESPWLLQLALALVVAEFFQYWLHRLEHEKDLLWRFHAVHHGAPRLYWLNAARFHPVDLWLLYIAGYLPLMILGCPEPVIALFAMFDAVFGFMQHCNVDVRLGPLNWIFSMAEPHRWHHSRVLREANTNYGSNLMLWDVVFRTQFLPAARPTTQIGIESMPNFPQSYLAQLLVPFRWRNTPVAAAEPLSNAMPHEVTVTLPDSDLGSSVATPGDRR